jgi:histidine triad (HIT) family protein
MATIFSKIIAGEISCHKIAENEQFFAFLDAFPLVEGHVLVVPKQEIDYIFDLPPAVLSDILNFAQPIAKAIEKAIPCARVGVSVIGLEVPHAHVHLVPINTIGDMNFQKTRPNFTKEEFESIAEAIKSHL